jgi:hypothetical protein
MSIDMMVRPKPETRKQMSREPKTTKTDRLNFWISTELKAELAAKAHELGMTLTDAAQYFIALGLGQPVDTSLGSLRYEVAVLSLKVARLQTQINSKP